MSKRTGPSWDGIQSLLNAPRPESVVDPNQSGMRERVHLRHGQAAKQSAPEGQTHAPCQRPGRKGIVGNVMIVIRN